MTRSQLVDRLSRKMKDRSRREVEKLVTTVFEEISHTLEKGRRVELRGFGAFFVKQRKESVGVDPRNGEKIKLEARHVPSFRASRVLRDFLNS